MAHVICAGVLLDTRRGKQRELFAKKGGNTSSYPRPFRRMGVFCAIQQSQIIKETMGKLAYTFASLITWRATRT